MGAPSRSDLARIARSGLDLDCLRPGQRSAIEADNDLLVLDDGPT
jgi:hypothetical protein